MFPREVPQKISLFANGAMAIEVTSAPPIRTRNQAARREAETARKATVRKIRTDTAMGL
jgi:hypothetical protein